MNRARCIYRLYEHGQLIGEGTAKDLAAEHFIAEKYIIWLSHTKKHVKRYQVKKIRSRSEWFIPADNFNYDKLKQKMVEFETRAVDMAEFINCSSSTMYRKLNQGSLFGRDEVKKLEDLFFLEEGELIND